MLATFFTVIIVIIVFIILFKVFKWLMRILLIVVFLGIAWLTNPETTDHIDAVEKAYPDVHAVAKHCNANDFFFFSLTEWMHGEPKVIGVGAFTQVIIFRSPN
jgi:hypothetical protein